jgi:hypothetical protein
MIPSSPIVVTRQPQDHRHTSVGSPRRSSPLHWLPLLLIVSLPSFLPAADLANLRVLFVTDDCVPGRTAAFKSWLKPLVKWVDVVCYSREKTPTKEVLASGDVILLDWNQISRDDGTNDSATEQDARYPNPLGQRESWSTPTLLLGSAGLMVGDTWRVAGDRGCTCLEPYAFDLRDHPITRGPLPVDRSVQIEIPLPDAFKNDLTEPTIPVFPLVPGPFKEAEENGWCVYLHALSHMPDIEWISGGVNHKTIHAGGIWRQGNLLHFGFQQSPSQMTELGRNLLANSIAYIADFHQDRPIARQCIGVQGEVFFPSRSGLSRWLRERTKEGEYYEFATKLLAPTERTTVEGLLHDDPGFDRWVTERDPYLEPHDQHTVLSVDEQLLAAHVTYDSPAFLSLVQDLLRSEHPESAHRLLANYLPECPFSLSPPEQAAWIEKHTPVLFAEDAGGYRWYVDPLALARGKSSAECRGPARRDLAGVICDPKTGACKLP